MHSVCVLERPLWPRNCQLSWGSMGCIWQCPSFSESLLITHGIQQTPIPSYLKEDEGEKHFGPSQKENSFSIWNQCCWKLFILFAARHVASSTSLHSSGTCRQLFKLSYGEISSYMLFEHFFPCPDKWCCQQRLLHFRAGKLCFWPDSLLGMQLEKKHDNVF